MICRLCLTEVVDFVPIFDESNDSRLAKIIAKYFHIELQIDDAVSNKICNVCWTHLDEFHKFSLLIEQRQQSLQKEFLTVKCDLYEESEGGGGAPELCPEDDVKNIQPLGEQPIDVLLDERQTLEAEEFEAANDTNINAEEVVLEESEESSAESNANKSSSPKSKITTRSSRICTLRSQTTDQSPQHRGRRIKKSVRNPSETMREHDEFIAAHATLKCCLCKQPLANFSQLKQHFRKEHQCSGYIICCNNRYSKRTPYVDHLKLHNNPELFKCTVCNKNLANRGSFQNHMDSCHPVAEALKFECSFCGKKFAKQYILDYHLNSHRGAEKEHLCEMCNKGYRSVTELKAHQKRVHMTTFKIMCDICGKNFKSKQSFEKHFEGVHQGVQQPEAQCQTCGKWLKDERSLYKHMYKHRDETSGKEFVCSKCGAVKSTRQTLVSHMRYHHPEKMHKCTVCEKEFKRMLALEEHMATHTGQALYTCAFCPQTFKSHANMHNHKKKVHPNEWVRKYSRPSKTLAKSCDSK